jgi:adenylyltransferase/sulfurtransferase
VRVRGEETPAPDLKVPEITPRELKARLDQGDDLFILDVPEPHEYQSCDLQGHLIPLGESPRRVHELDSSREIVWRTAGAGSVRRRRLNFLRKAGFRKLRNLKGGILAWSDEVDASVPKY